MTSPDSNQTPQPAGAAPAGPAAITLGELAAAHGLELRGDATRTITGVATLADAGPDDLAFLANPQYRSQLPTTRAGAVVLAAADADASPTAVLVSRNPYPDFAKIAARFERRSADAPGAHPTALVDATAVVDASASIGPYCTVGARSRIEAGAVLGPHCIVGDDCVVGAGSRLVARVTLVVRVRLGRRVTIHPGAVLGGSGFGLAKDKGRWMNVPQLGGVSVGDDCEIGCNTTIDRGALGDTVLEEDVRLDNQIMIGHNCHIGAHTAMAGCVGIAGSTKVGKNCLIAGAAGIVGHIEICDNVVISGLTMVHHSITEPGEYSSGTAMQDKKTWRKNAVRFKQLDEIARLVFARLKNSS